MSGSRKNPSSLFLGLEHSTDEEVLLPVKALNKHICVFGQSGSGKTVACKIIIEEAVRNEIPAIIIDPQGDISCLAMVEDYEKLNKSTRQYPVRLRDCFRNAGSQDNFNMKIIEDQLDKYQFGNTDVTVGDFEWENNIPDGRVIFTPRKNGRFKVSYLFLI